MRIKSLLPFFFVLLCTVNTLAEEKPYKHTLDTSLSSISYDDEESLKKFLWRVTGKRFILPDETPKLINRVDMLIERVMEVLDMRPPAFHVVIEIEPIYSDGNIASYSAPKKRIRVYADRVTDGIFAHEITHAVVSAYFMAPPPVKMQEIMAQYVDKHLWEDY